MQSTPGTSGPDSCTCRPPAAERSVEPRGDDDQGPGKPIGPMPSPTMRIAFASDRSGNFDIYTMNAQGADVKRLTSDPLPERDPAWSPDGKQIAFTRQDHVSDWFGDIYVMNADGSNQRLLVRGGGPRFSPDGRQIAYHGLADENIDLGNPPGIPLSIWVINVDGTDKRRITDRGSDPTWTPDGRTIVYGGVTGPIVNVWKINVAQGSKREQMYIDPIFACMPDVSPNGRQVAYITAIPEEGQSSSIALKLVVADVGAKHGTRVTGSPHWEFAPSWSPDGSLIAVERDLDLDPHYAEYAGGIAAGPGRSWIAIVRTDGSGELEIPNRTYSDADPSFSPGDS